VAGIIVRILNNLSAFCVLLTKNKLKMFNEKGKKSSCSVSVYLPGQIIGLHDNS
jgi:hypothetical protein